MAYVDQNHKQHESHLQCRPALLLGRHIQASARRGICRRYSLLLQLQRRRQRRLPPGPLMRGQP